MVNTRKNALCIYHGALVLAEFSKHEKTFVNCLGEARPRKEPTCPQCRVSTEFKEDRNGWLMCSGHECDFRILKEHYLDMIDHFNSFEYELDEFCNSFEITPFGETSV